MQSSLILCWKFLCRTGLGSNKPLMLKNGPFPASFNLFSAFFQTNITTFTTKCPSNIRCWESNPRPLDHKSPPMTTRQGSRPKRTSAVTSVSFFQRTKISVTENFTPAQWAILWARAERNVKYYNSIEQPWPDITVTFVVKRMSTVDKKLAVLPMISKYLPTLCR